MITFTLVFSLVTCTGSMCFVAVWVNGILDRSKDPDVPYLFKAVTALFVFFLCAALNSFGVYNSLKSNGFIAQDSAPTAEAKP